MMHSGKRSVVVALSVNMINSSVDHPDILQEGRNLLTYIVIRMSYVVVGIIISAS